MISPLNDAALEVGALLLAVPDAASRASIIAVSIVEQIPECACAIHRFSAENEEQSWTVIGAAGEISVERVVGVESFRNFPSIRHTIAVGVG